jgi:hypothetical protein
MRKSKDLLDNARECFRQAAAAANASNMKLLVELGLEYMRMAQGDAPDRLADDGEERIRIH